MAAKQAEKQIIKKEDVGEFPPTSPSTGIALLKPPTSLAGPSSQLTEAEKAFIGDSAEKPEGPTKLTSITIDHKACAFIMPDGSTVDGSDGIYGFIVADFTTRTYYEKAYNPKADPSPPECKSVNGVTPDADSPKKQNADCMTCQWNQFGTVAVGNGKACHEYVRLFLINPEFGTPPIAMLTLPPSAISKFYGSKMILGGKRGYRDHLMARTPAWKIIWSKITLVREDENAANVMPQFEMGDMAQSADVAKAIAAIHNQYVDSIKRIRLEVVNVPTNATE